MEQQEKISQNSNEKLFLKIIKEYENLIYYFYHKYKNYLPNYELEDLKAEMQLALYEAVQRYDNQANTKFITFAHIVIERRLQKLIRYSNVQKRKHKILDYYENPLYESYDANFWSQHPKSSEEIIEKKFKLEKIRELALNVLNSKEQLIFSYYLKSYKAREIANLLGWETKKVENSIYRIKKKIQKNYQDK